MAENEEEDKTIIWLLGQKLAKIKFNREVYEANKRVKERE